MIKIYGTKSDTVEIRGSQYKYKTLDAVDRVVKFWFTDGTAISITCAGIGRNARWKIEILEAGTAKQVLSTVAHTDVFEIDAEIIKHHRSARR